MPPGTPPPRHSRPTRNTGFWGWVERGILRLEHDPEARARTFKWAWIVSLAFTAFGFVIIARALLA